MSDAAPDAAPAASDAAVPAAPPPAYTGCQHYKRRCQLLAPCCNEFFACRFCHDAVKDEGEKNLKKAHKMDRHAVKTVKCMACGHAQAPAQACTACGVVLGRYFCGICNLFDDEDRGQWHCEGCGICRVG